MSGVNLYDVCCRVLPPSPGEFFLLEVGERFGENWGTDESLTELTEIVRRHVEIFSTQAEFDDSEALATGQSHVYAERLGHLQTPYDTMLYLAQQFEDPTETYEKEDLVRSAGRIITFLILREIIYSALGFDSLSGEESAKEAEAAETVALSLQTFASNFPILALKASYQAFKLCESCMSLEFIQTEMFGLSEMVDEEGG
jgi:hypothetical protein